MTNRNMLRKAIHNPAYVLWLLREHSIQSFDQLRAHFAHEGGTGYLREPLSRLRDSGLITWQDEYRDGVDRIEINTSSAEILATLGASLTELANRTHDTISVQPLFPRPHSSQNGADVFVLMPFKPELKPVYDDHLIKVCDSCGLLVARADDFFNTHEVMTDVWTAIYRSRVVIADCTGRNPNVFYELGIAHTIGIRHRTLFFY